MSGQSIDVADGLTAIVGPNNVGKNLFLRELHARIMVERDSMVNPPQKVVQSYEINYQGSVDDLLAILRLRCIEQPPGQYQNGAYAEPSFQLPNGNVLPHSQIHHKWGRKPAWVSWCNTSSCILGLKTASAWQEIPSASTFSSNSQTRQCS